MFLNVSKGQVASNDDLKSAFGTTNHEEIIQLILKKGELQVGSKEREAQSSQVHAEVIDIIVNKCINPTNKRQYPATIIEKTLKEIQFNILTNKPAKTQALEAIKSLVERQLIPISRARMRVRCSIDMPAKEIKKLKLQEKIKALTDEVEEENIDEDEYEIIAFIDPGSFRKIDQILQDETKGKGSLDVMEVAVVEQGEQQL